MVTTHAIYLDSMKSEVDENLLQEAALLESDGRPMAETDLHRILMIALLHALEEFYRKNPLVYVSGNIFIYYFDEAKKLQSVAPDVFVVFGVENKYRRSYFLEKESKGPEVVIELTSSSTKIEDLVTKHYIYARMGVREYFLFDPYSETVPSPLTGFRLEGGEYAPLKGTSLRSEVLGLDLVVEQGLLRLYNPKTGKRLRSPKETEEEFRNARKRLVRAFKARQKAEAKAVAAEAKAAQELAARQAAEAITAAAQAMTAAAEAKAAEELLKRQAAEAELARLRAELARLKESRP